MRSPRFLFLLCLPLASFFVPSGCGSTSSTGNPQNPSGGSGNPGTAGQARLRTSTWPTRPGLPQAAPSRSW